MTRPLPHGCPRSLAGRGARAMSSHPSMLTAVRLEQRSQPGMILPLGDF